MMATSEQESSAVGPSQTEVGRFEPYALTSTVEELQGCRAAAIAIN